jgi:hypothetical protein
LIVGRVGPWELCELRLDDKLLGLAMLLLPLLEAIVDEAVMEIEDGVEASCVWGSRQRVEPGTYVIGNWIQTWICANIAASKDWQLQVGMGPRHVFTQRTSLRRWLRKLVAVKVLTIFSHVTVRARDGTFVINWHIETTDSQVNGVMGAFDRHVSFTSLRIFGCLRLPARHVETGLIELSRRCGIRKDGIVRGVETEMKLLSNTCPFLLVIDEDAVTQPVLHIIIESRPIDRRIWPLLVVGNGFIRCQARKRVPNSLRPDMLGVVGDVWVNVVPDCSLELLLSVMLIDPTQQA